ncbi:MAG TPA: NUDIX hydrolase [Hyphomicrobiaceae bacterium]|nr:NUDIX hydrolase [Hyphomicrobiaceae bacterium]
MNVLNQYAALPYIETRDGLLVCLITSRGTKRWIIPKGWPKVGVTPSDMGAREAKEEAGLKGTVSDQPIGSYRYRKRLHLFASVMCRVSVYPLLVEAQSYDWREKAERRLQWMSTKKAAKRVSEPELAKLILGLEDWLAGQRTEFAASSG